MTESGLVEYLDRAFQDLKDGMIGYVRMETHEALAMRVLRLEALIDKIIWMVLSTVLLAILALVVRPFIGG